MNSDLSQLCDPSDDFFSFLKNDDLMYTKNTCPLLSFNALLNTTRCAHQEPAHMLQHCATCDCTWRTSTNCAFTYAFPEDSKPPTNFCSRKLQNTNKKCNSMASKKRQEIAKSIRRTITNSTYLRRLYLPADQALSIIPGDANLELDLVSNKRRSCTRNKITSHDVTLVTCDGRCWVVTFEFTVSTLGQRHFRLVDGWARFCRDNGVCVDDEIIFHPNRTGSNEIEVIIERRKVVDS